MRFKVLPPLLTNATPKRQCNVLFLGAFSPLASFYTVQNERLVRLVNYMLALHGTQVRRMHSITNSGFFTHLPKLHRVHEFCRKGFNSPAHEKKRFPLEFWNWMRMLVGCTREWVSPFSLPLINFRALPYLLSHRPNI